MGALAILLATAVSMGPAEHHIDFTRLFPPAATQRREYEEAVRNVERRRDRLTASPSDLVASLDAYSTALEKYERLDAYLYLRYATDTQHPELLHEEEALEADFERRTAFLRTEIARLDPSRARRLLVSARGQRYAPFVERVRRSSNTLTVREAEIVESLTPALTGWPGELYTALTERKETSPQLYAFTLLRLVRARTRVAQLRGFPDAASEAYRGADLTRADTRLLLDAVAAAAPSYVAFQKQRAEAAPLAVVPQYSFDDARAQLRAALAPLGSAYGGELAALLDPVNGRADIASGEHRLRGGFSKGFPGMTSVFFMTGFTGTYRDLRVMAHEGTHAVERQLQTRAGVPPVYASGPKFLMEALAITAELLLPRYLYEHETDPERRRFFLTQLLTTKGLVVLFRTAAEADLEERIYDGVTSGALQRAEDLDALTVTTFARYGITVPPDEWTRITLLFEDPFYNVNYTWADLVAVRLFANATTDPEAFAGKYSDALAAGFDRPADAWLQHWFGIDLRDPRLVTQALTTLQPYVDALRR
jgi:oligoendopeptidase F